MLMQYYSGKIKINVVNKVVSNYFLNVLFVVPKKKKVFNVLID